MSPITTFPRLSMLTMWYPLNVTELPALRLALLLLPVNLLPSLLYSAHAKHRCSWILPSHSPPNSISPGAIINMYVCIYVYKLTKSGDLDNLLLFLD
jgi:hypothetical protein